MCWKLSKSTEVKREASGITSILLAFAVAIGFLTSQAPACPLCSALSDPIRTELATCDYAVLAVCISPADPDAELPLPIFRVERSLVGSSLKTSETLKVYSSRDYKAGDHALLMGIGSMPDTEWGSSAPIGPVAVAYIDQVLSQLKSENKLQRPLPPINKVPVGSSRDKTVETEQKPSVNETPWLKFFWQHLESEDAWVRDDCFNAVAGISLEAMTPWARALPASDVTKRLDNRTTSLDHRRFYWVVLSLCGQAAERDFAKQEVFKQLNSSDDELPAAISDLDAVISCYLLLGGEPALAEIEQEILRKPTRRYSERCAAVSAIRVHAVEFKKIDRARLCRALGLALDDLDIADLVIPDLARLEDWSHLAKMVALYRTADKKHFYLRVPVINYLRACPLPEAQAALEECRQADPDAYRRATILFPSLMPTRSGT